MENKKQTNYKSIFAPIVLGEELFLKEKRKIQDKLFSFIETHGRNPNPFSSDPEEVDLYHECVGWDLI